MNEDCPPDPSDDEVDEVVDRLQQRIEEQRQSALQAFAVLCDDLSALGVSQVQLYYDGYGDEGTFNDVTALAGEKPVELDIPWQDRLRDTGCELLPGGWQDNSGSFGELVIDVTGRKLTREHNWRVEDSEYEEEVIDL